jgi:hypothetical protein
MKISLSIAAQDRLFSKAIRRVRPNFDVLFDAFYQVEITNPIYEAILIGLTDSEPAGYFEVIQNRDGFFQVLAGLKNDLDQSELKAELFNIIEQAVQSCPFTNSDKKRFTDLLQEWKPKLI